MPGDVDHDKHFRWTGIIGKVGSFLIGVIVASFFVGGARQRVADLGRWRDEVAPRIERMDSTGTISFDLFHKEYERTQHRQEEQLKALDNRIRELERR